MRPINKEILNIIRGGNNTYTDPGYGAQANGMQPNVSAGQNGMGLLQDGLSNSVAGGMVAGMAGGPIGMVVGVTGGMIAGGAFNGIGSSTSSANSGS